MPFQNDIVLLTPPPQKKEKGTHIHTHTPEDQHLQVNKWEKSLHLLGCKDAL